ncbi:Calx-beta domain-containing protein [Deltaproteobacteria bacterium TL4]
MKNLRVLGGFIIAVVFMFASCDLLKEESGGSKKLVKQEQTPGTSENTIGGLQDSGEDMSREELGGAANSSITTKEGSASSGTAGEGTETAGSVEPGVRIGEIQGETTEAGGVATFSLKLTAAPTVDINLKLESSNENEATVAPVKVFFTKENWNAEQIITVTGVDDDVKDGDQEYTVSLKKIMTFGSNYFGITPGDITLKNIDNESAGFTVSAAEGSITEGGGKATFKIKLNSQPTQNVTLPLVSNDPTEGTVKPSKLVFTPKNWDSSGHEVTVTGIKDMSVDGDQTYAILLGPAVSKDDTYNGLKPEDVQVTTIDGNKAGISVILEKRWFKLQTITTESGGTIRFSVKLNSQPSSTVTIAVTSSAPTEGTVKPAELVFTPDNWNASNHQITVTGVNDEALDGNQSYKVILAPAVSEDHNYSGLDAEAVSLTNKDNDSPGFLMSKVSGASSEEGSTASFSVQLASKPKANVVIPVKSKDLSEGTVSPAELVITPDNWNATSNVVTITGIDDDVSDGPQEFKVELGKVESKDLGYHEQDPEDVMVTNLDNDSPGFSVSKISGNTSEAGDKAVFRVKLTSKPSKKVTLPVSSSNENEGSVSVSKLTFTSENWSSEDHLVTVTGVNDDLVDGDQNYSILLGEANSSDKDYDGFKPGDLEIINVDNDSAGFELQLKTSWWNDTVETNENGDQVSFNVRLKSKPAADVTVSVSSSDETEATVTPSTLTFSTDNWNASNHWVTVTGINDDVADGDQAYAIMLGAANSRDLNYNELDPEDVSLSNADNDSPGITVLLKQSLFGSTSSTSESGKAIKFSVSLESQPTSNVTIPLNSSNPEEGIVDPSELIFTPENWKAVNHEVTVTGVDDSIDDETQAYRVVFVESISEDPTYNRVKLKEIQLSNQDDDTAGISVSTLSGETREEGTQATFSVRLNSQPTSAVTLPIASSDTSEGIVSPGQLVFTPQNWNATEHVVTLTGVNDSIDDGNQKYRIVLGVAMSEDPNYEGMDVEDVSVTNVDGDSAGFTVSSISNNVNEEGTSATFRVQLNSEPTSNVSVGVSSNDTTEATVKPDKLVFTAQNWNATSHIVTVTGVNDHVADGDQKVKVVLAKASSNDGKYNKEKPQDVFVVNTDDDSTGVLLSELSGKTAEDGDTATFSVRLTSQPTKSVTIPISSSNEKEGKVTPSKLVFTPTNWNATDHRIKVSGVDDSIADGDQEFKVILEKISSADKGYQAINPDDITIVNIDNDSSGILVSEPSGQLSENQDTVTFTVRLKSQPLQDVVLSLSSSNHNEAAVSPAELKFTPKNWNSTSHKVTVTGVNDEVADGDQSVTIDLGVIQSKDEHYNGLDPANISLVNVDNDSPGVILSVEKHWWREVTTTTEEGGSTSITVSLTSQPKSNVSFPIASSKPTEGAVNVSELVFTPEDWNAEHKITVMGVNEGIDDGDQNYVIEIGAASSQDSNYQSRDPGDVLLTNIDDDSAGVEVSLKEKVNWFAGTSAVKEEGTTNTIILSLKSQPTANVTLPITSSDTSEGTVTSSELVFTPANWKELEVIVTGVDDLVADGNQKFIVVLGALDSTDELYKNIVPKDIKITNMDNDSHGITVSEISSDTSENGDVAIFTVRLDSQPTKEVTIPLSVSDKTEGSLAVSALTFTPLNWNQPQKVSVTGVDDSKKDGDQKYTVSLEMAKSLDLKYLGLNPPNIKVVNKDND